MFPLALILFELVILTNLTSFVVPTLWFPNEPLIEAASREPLIEAASREPLTVAELKVLIVYALAPSEPLTVVELKVLIVSALAPSEPLILVLSDADISALSIVLSCIISDMILVSAIIILYLIFFHTFTSFFYMFNFL